MIRTMAAAGALTFCLVFAGAASARISLPDPGVADMRSGLVAAGEIVLSDAAVERWIKQPGYAAVSISNGADTDVLVSRYLLLDHGIHPESLQINISVFTGVAEGIWSKL